MVVTDPLSRGMAQEGLVTMTVTTIGVVQLSNTTKDQRTITDPMRAGFFLIKAGSESW